MGVWDETNGFFCRGIWREDSLRDTENGVQQSGGYFAAESGKISASRINMDKFT
jgi:hypothetical protein